MYVCVDRNNNKNYSERTAETRPGEKEHLIAARERLVSRARADETVNANASAARR